MERGAGVSARQPARLQRVLLQARLHRVLPQALLLRLERRRVRVQRVQPFRREARLRRGARSIVPRPFHLVHPRSRNRRTRDLCLSRVNSAGPYRVRGTAV
jgi:hypothetical protein